MEFFPVFLNLKNKKVLVVGGGDVACRKVDLLVRASAGVTLVSPELHPHLQQLVSDKKLTHVASTYDSSMVQGFHQVWATTDQPKLNRQIFEDADSQGIWTNVVDDPFHCHFITPSMIDRSPIQLAISSGGASPVLVRYIREKLETQLPQNLSLLADYAGKQRERIKQVFSTVDERRKFWEHFFRLAEVEQATTEQELEAAFSALLAKPEQASGAIYLIETGDDPEMLALKALRLMQQAEFVLYPQQGNPIFLDLCRRDADRETYASEESLIQKANELNAQGIRVCVLAEKGTLPVSMVAKGILVPAL